MFGSSSVGLCYSGNPSDYGQGILAHSNHMTSSKRADTLMCRTTMCRNSINFLYNLGHVTL